MQVFQTSSKLDQAEANLNVLTVTRAVQLEAVAKDAADMVRMILNSMQEHSEMLLRFTVNEIKVYT